MYCCIVAGQHQLSSRAVNSPRLPIFVNREGLIDDVITQAHNIICKENTRWLWLSQIFPMTQNAQKKLFAFQHLTCWLACFPPVTLLPGLWWHNRVYEEMFDVNCTIAQPMQNIWKFIISGKVSLQEMANFGNNIIRAISDSNLQTGIYSPKCGVSWIIWESWQHWNDNDGNNDDDYDEFASVVMFLGSIIMSTLSLLQIFLQMVLVSRLEPLLERVRLMKNWFGS